MRHAFLLILWCIFLAGVCSGVAGAENKPLQTARERYEQSPQSAKTAGDYVIALLKAGEFEKADKAAEAWERLDKRDRRLPAVKALFVKWKADPDPLRKDILFAEFAMELREAYRTHAKEVGRDMAGLTKQYEEANAELEKW